MTREPGLVWGAVLAVLASVMLACHSDSPRPVPRPPVLVLPDGTGDFPTIQAAIDAAEAGDVIELGDGTFRGDGNRDIDFRGKDVVVRSRSGDPDNCIIDCEGDSLNPHRGFYFHSHESRSARVEGLTITGGSVWSSAGGAVLCTWANPTFASCRFVSNFSRGLGGAVACYTQPVFPGGCLLCSPSVKTLSCRSKPHHG